MSFVLGTDLQPAGNFGIVEDTYIAGGFKIVDDTTARNNIPALRRKDGLLVYVKNIQKFFQLSGGIQDSNWQEVRMIPTGGSPGQILQINSSNNLTWANYSGGTGGGEANLPFADTNGQILAYNGTSWISLNAPTIKNNSLLWSGNNLVWGNPTTKLPLTTNVIASDITIALTISSFKYNALELNNIGTLKFYALLQSFNSMCRIGVFDVSTGNQIINLQSSLDVVEYKTSPITLTDGKVYEVRLWNEVTLEQSNLSFLATCKGCGLIVE